MDASVATRVLRLVGLGVRSRGAVVGVERVRDAARAGTLRLAIVASDASSNSRDKVVPLLQARRVEIAWMPSSSALGQAVGREQTTAVGIVDGQMAKGIRDLMDSAPVRSEGESD